VRRGASRQQRPVCGKAGAPPVSCAHAARAQSTLGGVTDDPTGGGGVAGALGAATAAPLGVLGIFWANAALLVGAMVVVAGSDAGAGTGTTEPQPPTG